MLASALMLTLPFDSFLAIVQAQLPVAPAAVHGKGKDAKEKEKERQVERERAAAQAAKAQLAAQGGLK